MKMLEKFETAFFIQFTLLLPRHPGEFDAGAERQIFKFYIIYGPEFLKTWSQFPE